MSATLHVMNIYSYLLLSSKSFILLLFKLMSIIHLALILECNAKSLFSFLFFQIETHVSSINYWKRFFRHCFASPPWQHKSHSHVWVRLSGLFILYHWYMCLYLIHYHTALIIRAQAFLLLSLYFTPHEWLCSLFKF